MRKYFMITALLALFIGNAQQNDKGPADFKVNVTTAQDVKMAVEGPHDDGGTLNLESTLEIEWNTFTVWTGVEWLTQIDYLKYTYLAFDFKVIRLADDRLSLSVGPEGSIIYRFDVNRQTDTGVSYILKAPAYLSYGGNATVDYALTRSLGLFVNTNVFKAEPFDNFGNTIDKEYRWDVRVGVKLTLFNSST